MTVIGSIGILLAWTGAAGLSAARAATPDLAPQKTPAVDRKMGEFTSNKKTNAANKSDQEACDLAFISAVIALQQRARKEGGNAVVNIRSVYKQEDSDSPTEFICGAGKIMAGVALRGTVVKLK